MDFESSVVNYSMTLTSVPRYDRTQIPDIGEKAIVVGASMAGLLTARVLADGFRKVTIIERDSLSDNPTPRRGVPQGRHIHTLLKAGRVTLEDLFPGYGESLLAAGGVQIDMMSDVLHYQNGDFLADGSSPLPAYYATRPLFEQIVQRQIRNTEGVELRTGYHCIDYIVNDETTAVQGIKTKHDGGKQAELRADLIVDATGRTSKTPAWLEDHGYQKPPLDEVEIDVAYSTVFGARPSDDRRALMVDPTSSQMRGVGAFPVENEQWILTYFGIGQHKPPADSETLLEFSANLPGPDPIELLDTQPRFSDGVDYYPFFSNRRNRYEELDRFPDGLVVIGDAISSFNPIYGQGMSVAALEALLLHHTLATGELDDLALRFFDGIEKIVNIAWSMAVGADSQYSQTTGPEPRGTVFFKWYLDRLASKAQTDGALREAFYRVYNMEKNPLTLLSPRIIWQVLKPDFLRY